jgi:large exoprotein involved in heme utilization and adhesion
VQLPAIPINVEVAQGCQAQGKQSSVAFYNIGRGGIAPNPYEPLSSSQIWEDVPSPSTSASTINSLHKIVEAQGWVVNETGEVALVAGVPASQGHCHL